MSEQISPVNIKIIGLILSESYQKCKIFATKLSKHHKKVFSPPSTRGLLERDWLEYLAKLRKDLGGQTWGIQKGVVVFTNKAFIGSEEEFFQRFKLYVCRDPSPEDIKSTARREYLEYLSRGNLLYTYMELSLAGKYMGCLLFELRTDLLPKTAVWFARLCDPQNSLGFSYRGSNVHRVCKRGWFQAGDVDRRLDKVLEDESLCYKHDRRGILSLCNRGRNTNLAQFFVTFEPSAWMDEFYVAFGRVVEGSDVLRRIENTACFYESPLQEIKITGCGLVEIGKGKHLPTKLKMKGLTIGDPHIHPDALVDLILDTFCDILFERLDEEIKREFHMEWIGQMIWDMIKPSLCAREPVANILDKRDRHSDIFLPDTYLKGLYDLKDIPDHYIMSLLNKIIVDVVEKSDVLDMARSIMSLILKSIKYREAGDIAAESFIKELMKHVNEVIFGTEISDTKIEQKGKTELGYLQKSISKIRSQRSNSHSLATGGQQSSHVSIIQRAEEFPVARQTSSTTESVIKFVIESLMLSIEASS